MKRYEDVHASRMTYREMAAQSSALQEAEMLEFQLRTRRGIPALLDGSRRVRRAHEHALIAAHHRDELSSLRLDQSGRQIARTEHTKHLLFQGITGERRLTIAYILEEYQELRETMDEHYGDSLHRASRMLDDARNYAHQPMLQQHCEQRAIRTLDEDEQFAGYLMRRFTESMSHSR